MNLINTTDYSIPALIWNGVGCFFWLLTYILLARSSYKHKFVEMPFMIAAGNIAWEFVWSFIVHPDTGLLYVWAYQGSFVLDVFIFSMVFLYGHKQIDIPIIQKYFKPMIVTLFLVWVALNYLFVKQGYDTPIGATSGYILNFIISSLCPILYLRNDPKLFSKWIGVCKFLGTGLISVSMFLIYPNNYFLQVLCVSCFVLDLGYILLVLKTEKDMNL